MFFVKWSLGDRHVTYLSFRFGRIVGSGSVGWVTVKGNAGTAAWPAESNRATAAKGNEVTR